MTGMLASLYNSALRTLRTHTSEQREAEAAGRHNLSPPFKAEDTSSVATSNSFCLIADTICASMAESEIVDGDTMEDMDSGGISWMYFSTVCSIPFNPAFDNS